MSERAAHLLSDAASEQPTACPAVAAAAGRALRRAEASVTCGLQGPAPARSLEVEVIAACLTSSRVGSRRHVTVR